MLSAHLCAAFELSSWYFELCDLTYKLFITALLVRLSSGAVAYAAALGVPACRCTASLRSRGSCSVRFLHVTATAVCKKVASLMFRRLSVLSRLDERMHLVTHTEVLLLFLAAMVLRAVGNPGQGSTIDIAMSFVCIVISLAVIVVFLAHAWMFLLYWFWSDLERCIGRIGLRLKLRRSTDGRNAQRASLESSDVTSTGTPKHRDQAQGEQAT